MQPTELISNILNDIKVDLLEEYDKNFTRKAYFADKWRRAGKYTGKGSLLIKSSALRRSIRARVSGRAVILSSSLPYARIHNEGGEIFVTRRMKRYFWAMYYKYAAKVRTLKNGQKSTSRSSTSSGEMADYYKSMALKKVGSKIKIPQRQFMGTGPEVERLIRAVVEANVKEYLNAIKISDK